MSRRLKKLTIKNTINTGRKKTEKGKIEGQELQFFLSTSDNRLQRVKSGARLFNIIHKKQENKRPIELIEHIIQKQSTQDKRLSQEEKKDIEFNLKEVFNSNIDMAKYLGHSKFDPCQEVIKEKNIEEFFKQKYNILMMYIDDNQTEKKPKLNLKKKSKRVYSQEIFNLSAVPDLKKTTSSKSRFSGFTSAQEKVQAIEDEVSRELEEEWEQIHKQKTEQEKMDQNIQRFYEKLLTQKKKVQAFIDPRSTKMRKNFKVINEHIDTMKKIDPAAKFLTDNRSGTSQNKAAKSNIKVLSEILATANQDSLPFGKKSPFKDPKQKRILKRKETQKSSKELFIPNENDFIDEYELEALQHRVLSKNIKQGYKRISSFRRFDSMDKNNSKNNIQAFQDFKKYMRPSTSQAILKQEKASRSKNLQGNEPKFLSEYQTLPEKDVKTYKDLQVDKHLMPLEINYKYKVDDFYTLKKPPPTAASHQREAQAKNRSVQTSQGRRIHNIKTSSSAVPVKRMRNFQNFRTSSAKKNVESIPSKRPWIQDSNFPEDFAIENTLGQYPSMIPKNFEDLADNFIQESSSEFISSSATKDPTEMVLHMKGPIYSTAKRNDESHENSEKNWKNRAYMVKTKTNQFFRQAKHNYNSLYTKINF
ncbi:unnamed protein product [Moneuplotes crassus]|uniref:Uncharacterized protein n=1 Tax=Euplotes crassus TaxID=5936 RepID=A0AAD1U580_EUPCR|nr:unnamed protein product [Moneuplotes crassus]